MNNIIYFFLGGSFIVITILFIKYKIAKRKANNYKVTKKEEKALEKVVKEKYKKEQEIEKKHQEKEAIIAENVADVSIKHDKRKNDMRHLFKKKERK